MLHLFRYLENSIINLLDHWQYVPLRSTSEGLQPTQCGLCSLDYNALVCTCSTLVVTLC